ncbi:MAG: dihydrofolate reductase family protein [Chloroflexota bacterium]|nr:dihydrofolate reductase family protein [Chloroflexota bacterium]
MARVVAGMTISLDGYVNDRNGSVARLYPDFESFRSSEQLQALIRATGAVVMGRRAYEMGDDYTDYEFQAPIFVLTHQPPQQVAKGENDRLRFTFVTDGIERAIRQAKDVAGDKDVTVIGGANTVQQCLQAGLVDELHIDIRPILLGNGLRFFEHLDAERIVLERISVTETPTTTNLRFRVVR